MKITVKYFESGIARFLRVLFSNTFRLPLTDTFFGRSLASLCSPVFSVLALSLSVGLFWYEGFIVQYLPFLGNYFLAPALLLIGFLLVGKKNIVLGKMHFWFLLFLITALFSSVIGLSLGVQKLTLLSGFFLFLQFGLAVIIGQSFAEKREVLFRTLLLGALPIMVFSVYQVFLLKPSSGLWLSIYETEHTRAFGFFGSPNVLGILASFMVFLALGLYLKNKRKEYLLVSALVLLVMVLTLSRSAWLGFLVAILLISIAAYKKIFYFLPFVLGSFLIPQVRGRIAVLFDPRYLFDSYLDGRIWSFINGIALIKKFPFGTGAGSYGGALAVRSASPVYLSGIQDGYTALYYTDNQYIQILVQTGLLGLFFFFSFVTSVFLLLFRKRDVLSIAAFGVFVCFIVSGTFANVLEFSAVAVPAGLIIGSSVND